MPSLVCIRGRPKLTCASSTRGVICIKFTMFQKLTTCRFGSAKQLAKLLAAACLRKAFVVTKRGKVKFDNLADASSWLRGFQEFVLISGRVIYFKLQLGNFQPTRYRLQVLTVCMCVLLVDSWVIRFARCIVSLGCPRVATKAWSNYKLVLSVLKCQTQLCVSMHRRCLLLARKLGL